MDVRDSVPTAAFVRLGAHRPRFVGLPQQRTADRADRRVRTPRPRVQSGRHTLERAQVREALLDVYRARRRSSGHGGDPKPPRRPGSRVPVLSELVSISTQGSGPGDSRSGEQVLSDLISRTAPVVRGRVHGLPAAALNGSEHFSQVRILRLPLCRQQFRPTARDRFSSASR